MLQSPRPHRGRYSAKRKRDDRDSQIANLQRKLVAITMNNELRYEKIHTMEDGLPLARRWLKTFESIEALRLALIDFKHRYNHGWLVQKHGHITPRQAREKLTTTAAQAA